MRVIGTAGHVDHGKSTLVEALTGIHPDRLKEEQEREMTIDLGFAWLSLPSPQGNEEEVGIVDVPGHRDFIENMLAGVGGIDAALFVVAADEGVMPQTREHLAILDILQIQGGVVALTKVDLIDDVDWLELVENDLRQVLAGTVLENAPIVRVSARTGAGLAELKSVLGAVLAERPPRPDLNRPRLPIDRAFTIAGFGSVVTGTLSDGSLRVGEEIEILPKGLRGRIRGLQTHKQKEQVAVPGSRTAVNISGLSLDQITRGDVVAHSGDYLATQRLDVRFRLLPDIIQPLQHNTEVKLFIGAAEVVARLRLLGSEELFPGESGWLQLELNQPVIAVRGDHYILRRPSPGETLGGGKVVDPHPDRRHKRFSQATLERLAALSQGTPGDILLQALLALGAAPLKDIIARSNLEAEYARQAVQELGELGQLLNLEGDASRSAGAFAPDDLVISKGLWEQISARMLHEVESYHRAYPLRRGISREELKSRLKEFTRFSPRLFNAALRQLVASGEVQENGPLVLRSGHTIQLTPQQQNSLDRLLKRFAAAPYAPPSYKECQEELGSEELAAATLELDHLVAVAPDVVFRKEDYEHMLADVRRLMQQQGTLSVAQVRDHFNTSRRYILALLEHLDAIGVTIRDGDVRRLKI
ncbi:MAG: selenocysteine-specific translation elongation factor [Anaerolineales bacterium]|nr:selenocysteine-specific translation elongation factor [Anaerolineales bacterium]